MKCVIAFSCLLAVASAGYLGTAAVGGVYGGAIGYANHGSHAVAYNAPLVSAPHPVHVGYAGPYAHGYAHAAPIAHGYAHGSHAVAYNAPLVAAAHPVNIGYAGPLAHAYAAHTGPVAHGYAHAAPIAHGYAHAAPLALASEARLVDPVAIAAGAPLPTGDTVEVAAAKAFHHQAHVEAKTGHLLSKGHYLVKRSPGYLNAGVAVASPLAYAAPVSYAVAAPAHSYSYSSQITHAAPVHSYGLSTYASPLAYSAVASPLAYAGHSGYGYGGHVGSYYG